MAGSGETAQDRPPTETMILAINTSTLQFSLALLSEDGSVEADYLMSRGVRHFGGLMPALQFLLAQLQRHTPEIKAVVVAKGPGSFTGLRVGIAAAKGLCHGLGIPVIGISSLEALASQLPGAATPVAPLLDSRRGEVFTAQFAFEKGRGPIRKGQDTCVPHAELPRLFKEPTESRGL